MANVIDMQDIRYLNLFDKITRVRTRFCFKYNGMVVFCVPKSLVSRSIGENGANIKRISSIIKKRVKVVPGISEPNEIEKIKKFIENVVAPITFNDLNFEGNEIILTAGGQSKAMLIGRNKQRLYELQKISKDYFGKELKIV
jgi:transcription antitermination factor NusA-like protein